MAKAAGRNGLIALAVGAGGEAVSEGITLDCNKLVGESTEPGLLGRVVSQPCFLNGAAVWMEFCYSTAAEPTPGLRAVLQNLSIH